MKTTMGHANKAAIATYKLKRLNCILNNVFTVFKDFTIHNAMSYSTKLS